MKQIERRVMMDLVIQKNCLETAMRITRHSRDQEWMGLMAGKPVSRILELPAETGPAHARTDPVSLTRALQKARETGLAPTGLIHSHAGFDVFHSGTDEECLRWLMPKLATWSFERNSPSISVPALTGPDSAVLPLSDGRQIEGRLIGNPIPGMNSARESAAWSFNLLECTGKAENATAFVDGDRLVLEAKGVRLLLGFSTGQSVSLQTVEPLDTHRRSLLFSLVVNAKGKTFAEAFVVHDIGGHTFIERQECKVVIDDGVERNGG